MRHQFSKTEVKQAKTLTHLEEKRIMINIEYLKSTTADFHLFTAKDTRKNG
jgi:hypothetical protein